MADILKEFKLTIGDLDTSSTTMDDYYNQYIEMAKEDLRLQDISEERLDSVAGHQLICIEAEALMNHTDIANNATITLLKRQLSNATKGDRWNEEQTQVSDNS